MILQNQDTGIRRRVPVLLVDSDGDPVTGVTTPTITVTKSDLTDASGGGIWTVVGGGVYYYELSEAQVATLGFLAIHPMVEAIPGSFKYDLPQGSGGRIPVGDSLILTFRATIDDEVRTYREAVKRDA